MHAVGAARQGHVNARVHQQADSPALQQAGRDNTDQLAGAETLFPDLDHIHSGVIESRYPIRQAF
jgi:hypothetical protein